jgi:hypothetical protein
MKVVNDYAKAHLPVIFVTKRQNLKSYRGRTRVDLNRVISGDESLIT